MTISITSAAVIASAKERIPAARTERIGRRLISFKPSLIANVAEIVIYGGQPIGDIKIVEGKYNFVFRPSIIRSPIQVVVTGKPVRDLTIARSRAAKSVQALLDLTNALFSK